MSILKTLSLVVGLGIAFGAGIVADRTVKASQEQGSGPGIAPLTCPCLRVEVVPVVSPRPLEVPAEQ